MGRHETIRLRETSEMLASDAHVIDAKYTEVRDPRTTIWGRIKAALLAVLWAAAIGFMIPPAWVLIQTIGQSFRPF